MLNGFGVPSYGTGVLSDSPGCTAVSLVVKRAVVGRTRFLRRRVESNIAQGRGKKWIHDLEGLNGAIEVLVINGVLIVVDASVGACHLVSDEEKPVVTRIRLKLVYCCACPGLDSGLHPHGATNSRK